MLFMYTCIQECCKQAEIELGQCVPVANTEFTFSHTKCIQLSLEKKRTPGWLVTLKNNNPVSALMTMYNKITCSLESVQLMYAVCTTGDRRSCQSLHFATQSM